MLHKPILARCDDRTRQARTHPNGEPEEWLADTYLEPFGLVGVTFDFFVNWNANSIPKELWIKRIVDEAFTPWPITHGRDIPGAIYQCDGEQKVRQLCRLADRHHFTCHYFLFKESVYWGTRPEPIAEVRFDGNGTVVRILRVKLPNLIDRIKQLRGGPASVGPKGLTYGLTLLECHLSKTDALWPGDADLVLVDSVFTPRAIVEFKKDTIGTPISSETLSNYYPRPDTRKYNSFAHLRDHFTDDPSTLPIIILYYSVKVPLDQQVKLERIEGAAGRLRSVNSELLPLPDANDEASCRNLVDALLGMI